MPMFKAPKVKLFKVQFTKTIATYVLAREQKDLKRALEDVDLYDDLWVRGSPVRAIVEAVAKVTGIKQVTDVKGLPKDVTPWTSRACPGSTRASFCARSTLRSRRASTRLASCSSTS